MNDYSQLVIRICYIFIIAGLIFIAYNYINLKKQNQINSELAKANITKNKLNSNTTTLPKDTIVTKYNEVAQTLDSTINFAATAAVYKETATKLEEVNTLRTEIAGLLNGKRTEENVTNAQVKIYLLQEKVALLQTRFLDISEENKRLQVLLNQILVSGKSSVNANGKISKNEVSLAQTLENEKPTISNAAVATGLHLFAVAGSNETSQSVEADKIVGSFLLKNITNKANTEVVVVVIEPDGKVLKNSVWESGTFETNEGKKVYSRKIFFDAENAEKQVNFSLTPDNFSKGNYTMQVWYNGSMIAKMIKTLS